MSKQIMGRTQCRGNKIYLLLNELNCNFFISSRVFDQLGQLFPQENPNHLCSSREALERVCHSPFRQRAEQYGNPRMGLLFKSIVSVYKYYPGMRRE